MQKATNNSGLGEKYLGNVKRVINPNGSFNVLKKGGESKGVYQWLIGLPWSQFGVLVLGFYFVLNVLFALCYLAIGIEQLNGLPDTQPPFWSAFFFSAQTLTTVGYGGMSPAGFGASSLAAVEALIGLMGFALGTGLLYGRFSRPKSRLRFSDNVLITQGEKGMELHFQVANGTSHVLLDVDARLILKLTSNGPDGLRRNYYGLDLRVPRIHFFPLQWRIVHEIGPDSPLFEKRFDELDGREFELMILMRAFDDTYNQTIHARYSYTLEQLRWGRKFVRPYHVDAEGNTIMDLDLLNTHEEG